MPDNITQTTDNPYLLNRQHTVNNVYKELLVFRSVQDPNNYAAGTTPGKSINLYWVKTIKDYPYVEISHGKPDLKENAVLKAPTGNQHNYQSKIVATESLQFGETITVPNLEIADTGHIVGAKEQQLILPTIQTTYPITITNSNSHTVTVGHEKYTANLPSNATATTPTYSSISAGFGESIEIKSPQFDNWGHYRTLSTQTVKMPTITSGSSPILVSFNANNTTATISHNTATAVTPNFASVISASASSYTIALDAIYGLELPETDNYGHSVAKTTLNFAIEHPKPINNTFVYSYLTNEAGAKTYTVREKEQASRNPIQPTDISKNNQALKHKIEIYPYYPDSQSYAITNTTIPIKIKNNNFPSESRFYKNAILSIRIPDGYSSTITIPSSAASYIEATTSSLSNIYNYHLKDVPAATMGAQTLIEIILTANSATGNDGIVECNCNISDIYVSNIIFTNQQVISDNNPASGKVQIWGSDKILQLPVLELSEQGHVTQISQNGFKLPPYVTNYATIPVTTAIDHINNYLSNGSTISIIDQWNQGYTPTLIELIRNEIANGGGSSGDSSSIEYCCIQLNADVSVTNPRYIIQNNQIVPVEDISHGEQLNWENMKFGIYRQPNDKSPIMSLGENGYLSIDSTHKSAICKIPYKLGSSSKIYIRQFNLPNTVTTTSGHSDINDDFEWAWDTKVYEVIINSAGTINNPTICTVKCIIQDKESSTITTGKGFITLKLNGNVLNDANAVIGAAFRVYQSNSLTVNTMKPKVVYLPGDSSPYATTVIELPAGNYYVEQVCVPTTPPSEFSNWEIDNHVATITIVEGSNNMTTENTAIFNNISAIGGTGKVTSGGGDIVITDPGPGTGYGSEYAAKSAELENRISTLEQSTLQLTNISDLSSVNNLISRVTTLEGEVNPVEYDSTTGQMVAQNRFDEISTYKNTHDNSISLEESYKQLLLCYTGLVRAVGEKLYGSNSSNVNGFINAFTLDNYKSPTEPSYLPAGTVPEFTPN